MYSSKRGILYHYVWLSKRKGPLLAFKGGTVHYWFSNEESTFKMHLFTSLRGKGGGATIALYFTEIEKK
jgi:hypothetical protein